jgi:hypothetical protein
MKRMPGQAQYGARQPSRSGREVSEAKNYQAPLKPIGQIEKWSEKELCIR